MRLLLLLLLLALVLIEVASAQSLGVTDTKFNPQGVSIGPYQEHEFVSCNKSAVTLTVDSGQVANAAPQYGISLVGYEKVELEEAKSSRVTGWTWARRGVEIAAAAFVVCDLAKCWQIGNEEHPARWKIAIPLVGIGLPEAGKWIVKNTPSSEVVDRSKRLPDTGIFEIPAGRCVRYSVYGIAVP